MLEPFPLNFDVASTALVIIDMQRDFVLPGGFGEALGNDTSLLLAAVDPIQRVLTRAREIGMFVVHTRGSPSGPQRLSPAKLTRGGKTFIGGTARWVASWSAASRATTSFISSIRSTESP